MPIQLHIRAVSEALLRLVTDPGLWEAHAAAGRDNINAYRCVCVCVVCVLRVCALLCVHCCVCISGGLC